MGLLGLRALWELISFNLFNKLLNEADYEKKIQACRQKTEEAKANTVADDEMEILEKELEEEVGKGHLLMEEIR